MLNKKSVSGAKLFSLKPLFLAILMVGITGNITFAEVAKDSKQPTQPPKVEKPQPPKPEKPEVKPPKVELPKPEKPEVKPPKVELPKPEKPEVKPPKVELPKPEKPEVKPPKMKFTDAQIKALEMAANKLNLVLLMDENKQPVLPNEKGLCPANSKVAPLVLEMPGMKVKQQYCVK
jgi:outer membrane biosynthesis protein TonB